MRAPLRCRRIQATSWRSSGYALSVLAWEGVASLGLDAWGQPARSEREGPTAVQEITHPSGAGRGRAVGMAVRLRPW